MPVPHPIHLTGSEESPLDTGAGKDLCVPMCPRDRVPEDRLGRGGWCWHFRVFHVKHPPNIRGRNTPTLPTNYLDVTLISVGEDDDAPRRFRTLALAVHTLHRGDGVVNDLALEGRHRRQLFALTGLQHPLSHLVPEGGQLVASASAPLGDVEHQPAALTRLLMHGQPGQLLKRVEHLALAADQ